MFRRLAFENSSALFTIVAFVTAASIYVTFGWRALRMKRAQVVRFENLPFDTATPAAARRRAPDLHQPRRRAERRPSGAKSVSS